MDNADGNYTVHAGWVMTTARTLEFHGCRSQDVFSQAGIDFQDISNSFQRIPAGPLNQIWRLAEVEIGKSDFGLDAYRFINPTTFHALGTAL